ncbi:MAG: S1C family serine protease [Nocardioidaceae bacterium]
MTDEEPTPREDDTRKLPDENTHRFGAGGPGGPPYSYGFPGYPEPARPPRRPGNGVVAAILAAALVVGVLGGLAGAAGFTVVDGLVGGGNGSSSTGVVSSPVDNSKNVAAAKGSDQQVAATVLPSVVKINVSGAQGSGSGSGVILSSDGEILTNNHVVALAGQGGQISVNFNDGTARRATVLGTDPLTDLAVIKAANISGLHPATIDTSGDVAVGQSVLAIGSPFGLQSTVTRGIVSALNRPVSVGETQGTATTYPAIQTDAAINPGNSGGPLVNMAGEVVGINSSIRTAGSSSPFGGTSQGGSIGLGFAIPIDKVWPVVQQLRKGITPTHARLGVSVTDAQSKNGLLTGAGVESVNAGSAAQKAGLKRGDVITAVNGQPVSGSESLVATIRGFRPGDTVTLTVLSNNSRHQVKVTLDSDNGSASS